MMLASRFSSHLCHRCHAPLVELLSDIAGRLFGCECCRSVDAGNALPPAYVAERVRSRRERRRAARIGRRGRDLGRRVPKKQTLERPLPERFAVLRSETFYGLGRIVRVLGDGWALGVIPSGPWALPTRKMPLVPARWDGSALAPSIETTVIELLPIAGLAFGVADKEAPSRVWQEAFDQMGRERLHRVAGFLEALR